VNPTFIAAIALMVIVTTLGNHFLPSRGERRRRALAELPPARIGEARGAVRVSGRVRRDADLLKAPLSGRSCIAYYLVINVFVGGGRGSVGRSSWRRVLDAQGASPFLITDESGTARIDTSGPFALAFAPDLVDQTKGLYPGKHSKLSELLESKGFRTTNWLGRWLPFRYEEGVIEEGALVEVGADSAEEIDPRGERSGLRSPPERLVLRGTEERPLVIAKGQ
jgi:hypothetical protein